jgi:hypothetical protein
MDEILQQFTRKNKEKGILVEAQIGGYGLSHSYAILPSNSVINEL